MFRKYFYCENDFYMHTLGLLFANLQGYTLSEGSHKFINFDGQLRISIYVDNNNKVSYDFRMLVLDLTIIKDMGCLNWYLSHGELFEQIYNEIKQKITNVRRKRKFSTGRRKNGTKHGKNGIYTTDSSTSVVNDLAVFKECKSETEVAKKLNEFLPKHISLINLKQLSKNIHQITQALDCSEIVAEALKDVDCEKVVKTLLNQKNVSDVLAAIKKVKDDK